MREEHGLGLRKGVRGRLEEIHEVGMVCISDICAYLSAGRVVWPDRLSCLVLVTELGGQVPSFNDISGSSV